MQIFMHTNRFNGDPAYQAPWAYPPGRSLDCIRAGMAKAETDLLRRGIRGRVHYRFARAADRPEAFRIARAPDSAGENPAELIRLARRAPLAYASPGIGTSPHLSMERIKALAKIDITHVPYQPAQAVTALIGGQTPVLSTSVSIQLPHISGCRRWPLHDRRRDVSRGRCPFARRSFRRCDCRRGGGRSRAVLLRALPT
jgi:tripartite-type tricarboxylate transporter receptor subunit TctC